MSSSHTRSQNLTAWQNGPKVGRIRKDIIALFKEEGLLITIETNLIETDFLDVTFNLATKRYFPFRRAKNTAVYINAFSNHPPTIIKQLPKIINKRISDLSCNKEEFDKVKSVYESTLKDSGHFSSMSHNNSNTQNAWRNKNRKVIWFNPPYSQNMKTNIGKMFIKFVRKYFPRNNKYHKIFKLNTLKLSYCCTTNVGDIIKHNSKVLSKTNDNNNRKCNCRSKQDYPLNGECLIQCLVYKSTSTTSSNSFVYYGTSEGEFETRHDNHTKPFRHRECMNETELSETCVELKSLWFR